MPSEPKLPTLSLKEAAQREKLEAEVKGGFLVAAKALKVIRDSKLYRSTHKSFAGYLEQHFGRTRSWAYRLISSYEIVEELQKAQKSNSDDKARDNRLPSNAKQCRAIATVPKQKRVALWQAVLQESPDKQPSGKTIEAVAERLGLKEEKEGDVEIKQTPGGVDFSVMLDEETFHKLKRRQEKSGRATIAAVIKELLETTEG